MAQGWLKIHQSIQQHWIWEQPRYLKWWLDILMLAEYTTDTVIGNIHDNPELMKGGEQ